MNNLKKYVFLCLISLISVMVYVFISTATWTIPDNYDLLTIRNGITGDLYEVRGEDLADFCNRMESVEFHRCEICGPAMGFLYDLTFYVENEELDSIMLKGENKLYRQFCMYESSENMIALIEDFLGDLD